MSDRLRVLWPTSGWSSDEWLGVKATWSFPMAQYGIPQERFDELERQLLAELQVAVGEGLEAAFTGHNRPETRYEREQIGSTAETFHGIFAWLQSIDNELLVALLADGTIRGLSVVAGYIKGRISSFRRDEDYYEITAWLTFHPNLLTKLCLEHTVSFHGIKSVERCTWRSLTDEEQAAAAPTWPPSELFWVEIESVCTVYRYLVDEQANVHEHFVDTTNFGQVELVPDVNPIPVPRPVYRNPRSGQVVNEWPSQDGIDRAEHIAIIANIPRKQLEAAVRDAVSELFPDTDAISVNAEPYPIGPAAGEVTDFIVALFESRDALPAFIDNLSQAWVIVEIVRLTAGNLRIHLPTPRWKPTSTTTAQKRIFFPPAVLTALCESHVRRTFHPTAALSTDWYCLTAEFHGGYRSPSHPTNEVEYLVIVRTRRRKYRYRMWGNGEVASLWMSKGKQETQLATPSLFE